MKTEFSRRSFMIILGVTTATAAVVAKCTSSTNRFQSSKIPEGIGFLTAHCPEPDARPRTSAITYLATTLSLEG